ncbi:hypothetical protein, partial [Klebsiella variicola]|uniref:hypothetical protein n=1 Tax=Klebsiella variicola TaxID=244366 RepID=UPI002731C7F3
YAGLLAKVLALPVKVLRYPSREVSARVARCTNCSQSSTAAPVFLSIPIMANPYALLITRPW